MRTVEYEGHKFNEITFEGCTTLDPINDEPVSIIQSDGSWAVHKQYRYAHRRGWVNEKKVFPTKERALKSAVKFLKSQERHY